MFGKPYRWNKRHGKHGKSKTNCLLMRPCDAIWSRSNLHVAMPVLLPFGHSTQVNAIWVTSIRCYSILLANEIQGMSVEVSRWGTWNGFLCADSGVRARKLASLFGNLTEVSTQVSESIWPGFYVVLVYLRHFLFNYTLFFHLLELFLIWRIKQTTPPIWRQGNWPISFQHQTQYQVCMSREYHVFIIFWVPVHTTPENF